MYLISIFFLPQIIRNLSKLGLRYINISLFLPVVFWLTENNKQTNMAVDVRLIIPALDTKPFSK